MISQNIIQVLHKSLSAGPRWLLPMLISSIGLLFILVQISPAVLGRATLLNEIRGTQAYGQFRNYALEQTYQAGKRQYQSGSVPVNSLVNAIVSIVAEPTERGPAVIEESAEPRLKYDNLILYVGMWLMVVLTLFKTFGRSDLDSPSGLGNVDRGIGVAIEPRDITAETVLQDAVVQTEKQSEGMYSRSTLLLAGGIIMAFIGVAVFYLSLPAHTPNEPPANYLPKAIRPTGALIFIESIAWFLLRQYRALIEDFKTFNRVKQKRSNYLVAYKLLTAAQVRPEELFLAASLITENHTDRLKLGETTESLERLKSDDSNPIFALVDVIMKRTLNKE